MWMDPFTFNISFCLASFQYTIEQCSQNKVCNYHCRLQFRYLLLPIYFAKYPTAVSVAWAYRYIIHHDKRNTRTTKNATFIQKVHVKKLFSFSPTLPR